MSLPPEPRGLAIQMLGSFSVRMGGQIISDDSARSRKVWLLFKYLVAHRDRRIPAEALFDVLWADEDCQNPGKALQNLVYRLRMLLSRSVGDKKGGDYIIFSQGCYGWNTDMPYWLDIETFENNSKQAARMRMYDPEAAVGLLEGAISLYKGDFLPECPYVRWVVPLRSQYQRIYADCIHGLIDMYRMDGAHAHVVEICEQALSHNPYDEALHASLIDALIVQGKIPQAQAHYEAISAQLYRDLGVKPSRELKDVYRRIRDASGDTRPTLSTIQNALSEKQENRRAFFCDPETFHTLCMVEARRIPRSGKSVMLLLFTISTPNLQLPDSATIKATMSVLTTVLTTHLRMGDIITRWSETQCLVMLHSLTQEDSERVVERLLASFDRAYHGVPVTLQPTLQPLNPAQPMDLVSER